MSQFPSDYKQVLAGIKSKIHSAQTRAVLSVNAHLIQLYWEVGALLHNKIQQEEWGANVIIQLAQDLSKEMPAIAGFSRSNIYRMLAFYREYPNTKFVPQAVGQIETAQTETKVPQPGALFTPELLSSIPWGHHGELISKIKDLPTRAWYMQATIENGWSRSVLLMQIETSAHERFGKSTSNFALRLPAPESDLVQQSLKDPYIFDFLTINKDFQERELEQNLVKHMEKFLLELGAGFAFVGRQYHLELDGKDFYIDLLFYHLKLRCYIVIELKRGDFKPEYAGKVNFYCNLIDDTLRHASDNPTIGLILCQQPSKVMAEYALRGVDKPIGVSSYELTRALPEELQTSLPSIEQIERELGGKHE